MLCFNVSKSCLQAYGKTNGTVMFANLNLSAETTASLIAELRELQKRETEPKENTKYKKEELESVPQKNN